MNELLSLPLIELAQQLRARQASAVELMTAVLDRVDETHAALNALVARRDREALLTDARAADARLERGEGRTLEGIPFGVKDLEDAAGLVTSMGSLLFRDDVAKCDSTQVARLRAAGAIVVGKTNAPEFGFTAISKNLLYGTTRSPWNLERTPGGSSGGSAALLTGCVLPLVTASDGGGSIRIPASFTGAFGLKPSYGRVPRDPFKRWDSGDTAVYGPLTKTVEDGALVLDVVAGPSPGDPNSLPHPGLSYLEAVRAGLAGKLRIAFSPDLGYAVVQPDVAKAVLEGLQVFEGLGHEVRSLVGGPPFLAELWADCGNFEIAGGLHQQLREREPDITRAFARGLKRAWEMTPERWGEAARQRQALNLWCSEVFAEHDLLVTPTVPYDPPPAGGPFPTEIGGRPQPLAGVASFTIPFNLSWHPAATVRAGLSRAGLPIGLQIVGPRHRDELVLQAARAFERERPWHPHWPTRF